jgi:hypothetical protein
MIEGVHTRSRQGGNNIKVENREIENKKPPPPIKLQHSGRDIQQWMATMALTN